LSYLVLARKWRPQTFDEVVGQEAITRTLKNAISMGRVPHALLFTGPRGVGKTTLARIVAKALNCEKGPTPTPCGECSSCRQITQGTSLDVLEIDGASNTGVDDVRQLRESVQYRPSQSRYKVYIIDEVHMLSRGAFNALLKTLEEPPEHCYFIFATTEPHKVPQTIQSRCQRFDFRRIPPQIISERLKKIAEEEGITISEQGLKLIARQAEGSLRDAISLLDQAVSFAGKEIQEDKLFELLACVNRQYLFDLSGALVKAEPKTALEILEQVYRAGYDLKQFLKEFIDHFRDLLVVKFVSEPGELVELSEPEIDQLRKQANMASEEQLNLIFEFLLQAEEKLARTEYPKVVLEYAFVKCASIKPMLGIEELISRLDELEQKLVGSGIDREELELRQDESYQTSEQKNYTEEKENLSQTQLNTSTSFPTEAEKDWNGFIEYLAEKSPGIAGILKNGEFLGKENGKITIAFKGNDFCMEILESREERERISKFASEYFEEKLSLVCISEKDDNEKKKRAQGIVQEEHRKRLIEHPFVQKALELFNARLEEVKLGERKESD